MSIRAMFVGNAPARAGAAAAAKKPAPELTDRGEQELSRAMLGEELPEPAPVRGKPGTEMAKPGQPA